MRCVAKRTKPSTGNGKGETTYQLAGIFAFGIVPPDFDLQIQRFLFANKFGSNSGAQERKFSHILQYRTRTTSHSGIPSACVLLLQGKGITGRQEIDEMLEAYERKLFIVLAPARSSIAIWVTKMTAALPQDMRTTSGVYTRKSILLR